MLPHSAQLALLNAEAVAEALRFKPKAILSMHLVASPAAAAIKRALGSTRRAVLPCARDRCSAAAGCICC